MKRPRNLPDWLADVQEAYQYACRKFQAGTLPVSDITDLFRTAAPIAAKRRGISDPKRIQKMRDYAESEIEDDLDLGAERAEYKFNFVYTYIHAHTPAGILHGREADDVMEYVNGLWNLFFDLSE